MKFYAGIGSRKTPDPVLEQMQAIAIRLRQADWWLRSGGAVGADSAFEDGAGDQSEIWLPYNGFNSRFTQKSERYHILNRKQRREASVITQKYYHHGKPLTPGVEEFMDRNAAQVLGGHLLQASDEEISKMIICWTRDGKDSGGTGQAIRIAVDLAIPVYNLKKDEDRESLSRFLLTL